MEASTSMSSLPDDLLLAILRRSFQQLASCKSRIDSLWASSYECSSTSNCTEQDDAIVNTPIASPPPLAHASQNLLLASVCRRWRRLTKLHVTTLSVKADLLVSQENLSIAVACFPSLTHLHLSDSSVKSLDDAFLAQLASSCPQLTALHPVGAPGVTQPACLKSLNFMLCCPDINTIFPPASPFTWLEELLITQCSELETLPDRIGDLLPCLRKLTIRECYYFAHLPESFTSLYHLEELFISTCNDFTLPTNFGHLPTLKLLVLESLSFTEFPPSFCHLTSLEALFLVDCHPLLNLPAGFCHLIALKALCFSRCEGLALPEDVGALARLESLRLHNCQHEPLPRSFTDLSSLTSLELSACFGGELPALGELSRLQELKIIDLPISTLPTSLTRLTGLQSLEVRGCQALSEVPPRLDMLVGLKRLVLTECEELGRPPAGLPPSLETLCLGPFVEGSSHVVDVSRLSQLRVLKLNCVGVRSAVNSNLACQEEQDEQVGQVGQVGQEEWVGQVGQVGQGGQGGQGEQGGQEGRGEHVEQGGQGKQGGKRGQGEQGGQGVQLHKLERLEMRLDSYIQELPIPLTFLPRLRSLLIDAPRVCSFPENMGAALPQLRQLELLSWSPEKLPGSIVHLRSLTSLMVEAPQLVSLPQGISCLSRLRRLELIRCIALQHSTELLLSQLASLQHLILNDAPGTPLPVTYVLLTDKP
ncbi:unnamed protein product [Closterium sp. Naga37s-1]|nr:unnamed protein product [Closterium sp. Naga37s-1]